MDNLSFVPLSTDHFHLLHKWMQEPHVSQWWGEGKTWSFEEIQKKYHSYTLGYKIEQEVHREGRRNPLIISSELFNLDRQQEGIHNAH